MTLAAERYGVRELTVNEQNPQAVGFYEHLGFSVWKRTERDEEGGEYPLLYMRKEDTARVLRAVSYLRMGIRCALRLGWLCQPATLAPREVFFATYTPQKTIRLYSRLASRELCETFLQRNASAVADAFVWGYSSFSSVFSCGSGCADAAAAWPEAKAALLASSSSLRRASSARAASFSLRRRAAALPMF